MKINIFFLLFSLNSFARSQDLKDILYECYDFDCQEPISWGKTLQMYAAKSDKHLSFNRNEDVIVVSKPGDKSKFDEGFVAIIRGKVGLVPPSMIREDKMGKKRLLQRYPFQFLPIWTEELTNKELISSEQPDDPADIQLDLEGSTHPIENVELKVNAENESNSDEENNTDSSGSEVIDGTTISLSIQSSATTLPIDYATPGLSNDSQMESEGDSPEMGVESQETTAEAASSELPFASDSTQKHIPTPSFKEIDLNVESSRTENNQDALHHHPHEYEANLTLEDESLFNNNGSLSNDFDLEDENSLYIGENTTEESDNEKIPIDDHALNDSSQEPFNSTEEELEEQENETKEAHEEEAIKKSIEIEIPSLPPAPSIDERIEKEITPPGPPKENELEMENNSIEGISEPLSLDPKPIEVKVEPEVLIIEIPSIPTPEITTELPPVQSHEEHEEVPLVQIEIEPTPLPPRDEEKKSSFFGLYDSVTKWFSSDEVKKTENGQENFELNNNQLSTEPPSNDQPIGEKLEEKESQEPDNQTEASEIPSGMNENSLPIQSNEPNNESDNGKLENDKDYENDVNDQEKKLTVEVSEKKEIVDPINDMIKSRSFQQPTHETTTNSPIIHEYVNLNEDKNVSQVEFTTPEPEMTSPIPRQEIHPEHDHSQHEHHHHHGHHHHKHLKESKEEESKSSILLVIKHLSSTLLQFLPEHLQDTILDVDDALVFSGIIALTLISICVPYFFIEGFFAVRPLKKKVVELNKNLWKVRSAYENQQEEFAHFKEKALAYDEDKNRIEELEFELDIVKKLEGKQKDQVRVLQKEIKHSARVASEVENLVETTLQARDKAVEEKDKLKSALTKVQDLLRKTTEESEQYQSLYSTLSMDYELEKHAVETHRLKNQAFENELRDVKGKLAIEVDLREKAEDEIDLLSNEKSQLHEETLDLKRILAQYESTVSNLNSEIGHRESELAGLKELLGEDSPLVEIAETKTQLLIAQEESISLASRLEAANLEKNSLQKRAEAADEELHELRTNKNTAENRLRVLEQWFKEKEEELKAVVAKYEVEKSVRGRDKDDLIFLIEEKDEEISQLLQRTETLKTEHEEAKTAHRAEMRALESKGHENWLSLCQSERRAQDARKEAEILRQRLLALTKEKDFVDNQDTGSVNGDGGLFGSLVPPELVPLPIDEMIDPFFGSDFLPPPPLPVGEEPLRPPPVGRFSPNYSDEDCTLSPISRRPNNLSDTRSSRSNSPPSGGRRGSWRRRQRPGGPVTSSPVNQ